MALAPPAAPLWAGRWHDAAVGRSCSSTGGSTCGLSSSTGSRQGRQVPRATAATALALSAAVAVAGLRGRGRRRRRVAVAAGTSVEHLFGAAPTMPGHKPKAYRMPLPPDVDEIQPPRWKVLIDAVKNCSAEDAVVPTWKLKPRLGINSPTPQYAPLHYIEPKPYWMKSAFVKRKMKKFYNKMRELQMAKEDYRLRFLPDPKDRLSLAGTQLLAGSGAFKAEEQSWKALRKLSADELVKAMNDQRTIRLGKAGKTIALNWRPGYQQVAIRDLRDYMRRVDVVLEVRDARIPWASTHPDIADWVRPKPRVIVLTRADLVPPHALEETIAHIKASEQDRGVPVVAVDAQRGGQSIEDLRLELMKAGAYVNRRRKRKGVNPRAIRTILVGFPNVGKSSIINRLANRKVAKKTPLSGTTRRLTWHKIGGFRNTELEFLDMPGTIPYGFGKRYTEEQSNLLCMCKIFPDHIIDREKTAYELVHQVAKLSSEHPENVERTIWTETERIYGVDFQKAVRREGPFLPNFVPTRNPEPFCGKLLSDFNSGYWGRIQLEAPPEVVERRQDWSRTLSGSAEGQRSSQLAVAGGERARLALPAPRAVVRLGEKGLARDALPEIVPPRRKMEKVPLQVGPASGEGLFEGW